MTVTEHHGFEIYATGSTATYIKGSHPGGDKSQETEIYNHYFNHLYNML